VQLILKRDFITADLLQEDNFFFVVFLPDTNLNSEFRRYADGWLGTAF